MNNLNTLTRLGDSYPEAGTIPTMSSLQMVDYINADRKSKAEKEGLAFPCKKYRKLRHDNFMNKVPKVLGEIQSPKFLGDYLDDKGRTQPCYNFPKREACLMAMSYSYELQAEVYDYMEELDHQRGGYLGHSIGELQGIVAAARQQSDEDSSDAGRRLRKRKDDLVLLKKAECLVNSLSQLSLPFIEGQDNAK